ncbi:MAG: DUF983 domain-containing protein [Pseudomonadota bacterium]
MAGPKNVKLENRSGREFPELSPATTGLQGKCPRCGNGKLFNGLLDLAETCESCGLDYGFADAGDGPAVFVIFILGAFATGGVLFTEFVIGAPYVANLVTWGTATLILSIFLLRKMKGLLIAQQYVKKAAEGRLS